MCAVVAEWVDVVVDEELDVAALAIAAPPPTSAPVTRSVVMRDFSLRIGCSPPFWLWTRTHYPAPPSQQRRRQIRVSYEDPVIAGAATSSEVRRMQASVP